MTQPMKVCHRTVSELEKIKEKAINLHKTNPEILKISICARFGITMVRLSKWLREIKEIN
jgi:hypothetical protein